MGLVHDKKHVYCKCQTKTKMLNITRNNYNMSAVYIKTRKCVSGTPMPHLADIGEHPLLLKSLMGEIFGTALQKFAREEILSCFMHM